MKQISLTQGKIALVDDDIYEVVKDYRWCANFQHSIWYAVRNTSRKEDPNGKQYKIRLHHIVIGKPTKRLEVDHIDGNGLNNQRSNLRIVTRRVNDQNRIEHRKGKLVGAIFHKYSGKWQARIKIDGKRKSLGYFKTEQEAHKAYVEVMERLCHE